MPGAGVGPLVAGRMGEWLRTRHRVHQGIAWKLGLLCLMLIYRVSTLTVNAMQEQVKRRRTQRNSALFGKDWDAQLGLCDRNWRVTEGFTGPCRPVSSVAAVNADEARKLNLDQLCDAGLLVYQTRLLLSKLEEADSSFHRLVRGWYRPSWR